ncbi:uncharacterized protein N7500_001923 [Penicillium coprophilum]|uniref:uncharacterized protein n=1 Tax=Penicillium coprophilum TaxID=36646 RepID=UPI00239F205B|nr:uncharacterized protein N7500_001923 [Penicillium coprophilum]KAJ5173992.1 hypothetical protein N7500_001923 [Penicillium coprophilum]
MIPKSERDNEHIEKAGPLQSYNLLGPELIAVRSRARPLITAFNAPIPPEAPKSQVVSQRQDILGELFDFPPSLDCVGYIVSIGNDVMIGPTVNIIPEEHETGIEAGKARRGLDFTGSIIIGDDC